MGIYLNKELVLGKVKSKWKKEVKEKLWKAIDKEMKKKRKVVKNEVS